ncbi:beta-lactamase [Penicillium herquei]|nr:beta-lactamase [Penicillium herquei]
MSSPVEGFCDPAFEALRALLDEKLQSGEELGLAISVTIGEKNVASWWSPPGVSPGYHLTNQGHMIGEIIQRITGKPLGTFIRDKLANPLQADYQLGLSAESNWDRVADVTPPPLLKLPNGIDPNSVLMKTIAGIPIRAESAGTREFRLTELGAANGFSNARALARIGSLISNGGHTDGKKLISKEAIDLFLEEQVDGVDQVLGVRLRYGLGVGLPTPEAVPWLPPEGKLGFWGGWGGSILVMDLDRKMSIGYVMNKMGEGTLGNPALHEYVKLIYKIVEKMEIDTSA